MDIEGLNAIPILEEYKRNPDATYLVKLAVAGITNCLPNIDADGANSMGFHLHPANNVFDPYSGDWGIGFFASASNAANLCSAASFFLSCSSVSGTDGVARTGGGASVAPPAAAAADGPANSLLRFKPQLILC